MIYFVEVKFVNPLLRNIKSEVFKVEVEGDNYFHMQEAFIKAKVEYMKMHDIPFEEIEVLDYIKGPVCL